MTANGRLLHAYRDGQAKAPATASDYANMIWAALRLQRGDQRAALFRAGVGVGGRARQALLGRRQRRICNFGRRYARCDRAPAARDRRRGAQPNGIMLANLVALATLTADPRYTDRASAVLAAFAGDLGRNIVAYTGLLASTFDLLAPQQVVVAGQHLDGGQKLIKVIRSISLPGALQYALDDTPDGAALPGLREKNAVDRRATAYVCLGPQCSPSLTEPSELANTLKAHRSL